MHYLVHTIYCLSAVLHILSFWITAENQGDSPDPLQLLLRVSINSDAAS